MGGQQEPLSFTKPGGTPTSLTRLERLNPRGPQGWAENQSPIWEAWAEGEGIHLRMSETMWKRPREVAESSLNLSFTKGNNQLRDGQPVCPSPEERTGQRPEARTLRLVI